MIESIIISLVLTIIIEVLVAIGLGIKNLKEIVLIAFINIFTNPILVCIANITFLLNNYLFHIVVLLLLEITAFIVEGKLLKYYLGKKLIHPYKFSFYINLISFSIGIILNFLGGD